MPTWEVTKMKNGQNVPVSQNKEAMWSSKWERDLSVQRVEFWRHLKRLQAKGAEIFEKSFSQLIGLVYRAVKLNLMLISNWLTQHPRELKIKSNHDNIFDLYF